MISNGMKYIIVCSYLTLCALNSLAQDQIILHSAEELKGKVTEIKVDRIVYKDESNLDGPTIEVPKEDVFMIIYENGGTYIVTRTAEGSAVETKRPTQAKPKPTTDRMGRSKDDNLTLFEKRLKTGIPLTLIGIPCIAVGASMIDDVISRTPGRITKNGPFSGLTDAEALGIGIPLAAIGVAFTIIGPINIGAAINYKTRANSLALKTTIAPHIQMSEVFQGAGAEKTASVGLSVKVNF